MENFPNILRYLRTPEAAGYLSSLYGKREGMLVYQIERYTRLVKRYAELFGSLKGISFYSAPGRTEIGGNHTDHNSGRVLAAGVNLDTVACAAPSGNSIVTLHSEGYPKPFKIDLSSLDMEPSERESSNALIRGVAFKLRELGHTIGGFNAVVTSSVLGGSGLSSSAAFEVMVCKLLNGMFGDDQMSGSDMARIAQFAENAYFGKPSGMLDQSASAIGGMVTIDFRREEPRIETVKYDFNAKGYTLVVVNTGGTHANLTNEYASIPAEMRQVAAQFGCKVLREVLPEQVEQGISSLRGKVSDRAILRALHFFDENERVVGQVEALKRDDLDTFFRLIIESGESSWKLLQNLYVAGSTEQSLPLALDMARRMLQGKGAWRVHGGGFAGTILTFVPNDMVKSFAKNMESVFGAHSCTLLDIRPVGAQHWTLDM